MHPLNLNRGNWKTIFGEIPEPLVYDLLHKPFAAFQPNWMQNENFANDILTPFPPWWKLIHCTPIKLTLWEMKNPKLGNANKQWFWSSRCEICGWWKTGPARIHLLSASSIFLHHSLQSQELFKSFNKNLRLHQSRWQSCQVLHLTGSKWEGKPN